MNKIELERELEEAKATKFTDKLSMMLNVNTMSSKNNDGGSNDNSSGDGNGAGRPQKSDTDLTESGMKTRSNASNVEKGGNI